MLGKHRRFLAAGLSLAVIAFYTVLVGAGASVVRAALMGGFSLFAAQLGRRQNGLNSLAIVAAVMVIWTPSILWDVGFQLSFMATLGLVLYAGPFSQAFQRLASRWISLDTAKRLAGPVGEYFLFTLAAQLTTLPVTVYHFRQLSLVALVANPAILPAQPPIMALGGLATLLGALWLPLGRLLAALAWPFAAYTIRAVEFFAVIPGGAIQLGKVALWVVLAYYALLFALTFSGTQIRSRLAPVKPAPALALLGIAAVLVWHEVARTPDGRLHLSVLDTGGTKNSAAVLIQAPGGARVLINGGSNDTALGQALGRRLPLFDRRIDYLLVASAADNQLAALPQIIGRYPPQAALWAFKAGPGRNANLTMESLEKLDVPVTSVSSGQELRLGKGAVLRVVKAGESGAVLLLEWGNFRAMMLSGEPPAEPEAQALARQIGAVTALVLVEGNINPVEPPVWVVSLEPRVVIPLTLDSDLEASPGFTLLSVEQNDSIELITDGEQLWVEAERR